MRIRHLVTALAAALFWVSPTPPAAAKDPHVVEVTGTASGTPEADGSPVRLDVSLFTVGGAGSRPAIVLAHGFGGSKADLADAARDLARGGYAVVTYTARGFGTSGGRIHVGDPAFEGADTSAVIDWVAARPEVALAEGDPVLGFAGVSYGGNAALLAAARDRRVDAVVAAFTWGSLTQALFPQYLVSGPARSPADVPGGPGGVFKKEWAARFFRSGSAAPSTARTDPNGADRGPAALCGRFDLALCQGYLDTAARGAPTALFRRQIARADLAPHLRRITAPTLVIAGEQDTLFPLDQSDTIVRGLPASTPAALHWVDGGHDAEASTSSVLPSLEQWFGRHLRQEVGDDLAGFEVAVSQKGLVGRGDEGVRPPQRFVAPSYPGRGSPFVTTTVDLAGGPQRVVAPPGGTPASWTSVPGGTDINRLTSAATLTGYTLAVLPGQSARFTSEPLRGPSLLIGSARVRLVVTSTARSATLFAGLWDLGPEVTNGQGQRVPGTAALPLQAMAPIELTGLRPGRPTTVEVALPPVVHQIPAAHRWQLVVSTTDQAYAAPDRAAVHQIGLDGTALTLPVFTGAAVGRAGPDVPPALLVVVAAVLAGATGTILVLVRRRHAVQARDDLRDRPLVVEGLAKTYRGGFTAVSDVSFTAEPGQVVGLLGPNGAGKTTVMRMLVGLIRPDAGTIHVRGQRVHAGADVLATVGAFIEGPGFLPHLSGLANLEAYWAATGRPREEAHLGEALTIAGLGTAVHRQVRGYSQGMRQRLGIAQAMLGLPDLLVLDEPTNGLDPPQIRSMRQVLSDYARPGRTVVVSSHLLAEVQQTCSHVVVMDRGRVVLTGPMAELTASEDVTLVALAPGADVQSAVSVLVGLGLTVTETGEGLRVSGPVPRPQVVAELVAAGVPIDSVDGHRQLEEVFLTLVGEADL